MKTHRRLTVLAAAAALALVGPAAFADVVYNDLDASVDSTLETMALTFDPLTSTGATGATTLTLQIQGHVDGDKAGCNVQGNPHFITLAPVVTPVAPTVDASVSVALSNGGTLEACQNADGSLTPVGSQIVATVTPIALGTSDVTFVITDQQTATPGGPFPVTFDLGEAAFRVGVTEGSTPPVGCDVDPAAPAWSAAIMQKSKIKSGSKDWQSVQSKVAQAMAQRATFGGYEKNDHPAYENAVQAFVQATLTTKTIASAQASARPGWECVTQ